METGKFLNEIQKRLPDDIKIVNETSYELTEDEFLVILSWIKYFNWHYRIHKKFGAPEIQSPIISKRIRLDFYFYWYSEIIQNKDSGYLIYIKSNLKNSNGFENNKKSIKEIINEHQL